MVMVIRGKGWRAGAAKWYGNGNGENERCNAGSQHTTKLYRKDKTRQAFCHPPTRPDRLVTGFDTASSSNLTPLTSDRPQRCHEIHEAHRILRAKSHLGVLCTPVDTRPLGAAQIGMLYEAATVRLQRHMTGVDDRLRHEAHMPSCSTRGMPC